MNGDVVIVDAPTTQTEPEDFDVFWASTLAESRSFPAHTVVQPYETQLTTLDVFDVVFRGFAGDPVHAWLRVPRGHTGDLPGVVQFTGYGNGRGHALRDLRWASAGYAHLVVDARGQGHGVTDDGHRGGPSAGSYITRGLNSPDDYYYRRVYADAVLAVDALRALDIVDASRVGTVGASQGGGIALAIAGLVPDLAFTVVQAPALCELDIAPAVTDEIPYALLADHFAARRSELHRAQDTLRYFDGVNLARRAVSPALLSTGMRDRITPPETVLPAFTAYAGPKTVVLWPFNGHEAGGDLDEENALEFVGRIARDKPTTTQHGHQSRRAGTQSEEHR